MCAGRLRTVRSGALDATPIAGLPEIRAVVIGGLQDVALHPNYGRNRLVYCSYSKPDAQDPTLSTLAVARARFDASAKPTGQERLLTELEQRFRDVRVGPDGAVYLLTDETARRDAESRAAAPLMRRHATIRRRARD